MDDYMKPLAEANEKSFIDTFGNLQNDFDRLYVSNAARTFARYRQDETKSLEEKFCLLKIQQPMDQATRPKKDLNHRSRIEIMRKCVERKVKRKKIIRKRPKPQNIDKTWLSHSDTRSISVDYSCPKLIDTAEQVDNSMSDLYFQEEILID